MALLSGFDELNAASATFSDWLEKTNQMIVLMRDNVLTANTSGANTVGDAVLTGQLTANVIAIEDGLRGGSYTASANLFVTSNVEIQNTALLSIVWKDINVIGNANTNANLHVSETSGDLRAYGDAYVEQFLEIGSQVTGAVRNTTVDSLKITGANIEFNTYSSNSVAKMVTNDDGSLVIDADLGANGTADSILSLRVDNKDSLTVTSGNVDFYDATGASVQARWEGAHDTNTGGLGIRKTAPEANTALDVDAEVRVDQLTVDGSVTSNVYVGNTNWTDGSAGHAHWVNIRKSDASISGIGWQTTLADTTNHLDTVIKTIADESLVISVDDTARGVITADIDLQTAGVRRQTIYANGDIAFTNNGVDRVVWDDTRGSQGYFRHFDNVRATFGDSDDFNIYHNGTHSYIVDNGTGNTHIWTDTNLLIQNSDGTANSIVANTVGEVTLYHNNVEKLQTNTTGIEVYGEANTETARILGDANFDGSAGLNSNNVFWDASANTWNYRDDTIVAWGDGGDFTITHDGLNTYLQDTAGTGNVYLDTNNLIVRNAAADETLIDAIEDGSVRLYANNEIKLTTTFIGVDIEGEANTDTLRVQGDVQFENGAGVDEVTWNASASVLDVVDDVRIRFGDGQDLQIYHTGTESWIADSGTGNLFIEGTNLVLRATDDTRYLVGTDGTGVEIYSPDDSVALTANDNQVHISDLANTNLLRVRSTSLFENDISIEGSTSGEALSWDKTANTLNFNDNNFATFGTSGDLAIHHNASDSFIVNGTGDFVLRNTANDKDVIISSDDGSNGVTDYVRADGSTGEVLLYFYGTQKLETNAGGITVTGNTVADGFVAGDNEKLQLGDEQDLELYHDATDSLIENNTGALIIQNNVDDNDVIIKSDDSAGGLADYVRADGSTGEVVLSHYGSQKLQTKADGVWIEGEANTDTLRVQGTTDLEGNINVQGSTNADTLTWTKSTNTLNFDDNNFATFGTDGDLSIYHDGTDSQILNQVGSLVIKNTADDENITIQTDDGSGSFTNYIIAEGSTTGTLLYSGGNQKLRTTNTGITVTGTVVADGVTVGDDEIIQLGTTMQLYNDGANSYITETGTGNLNVQANSVALESTTGENYFTGIADGTATIYYNGAAKLATATGGVTVTGNVVSDGFVAGDGEKLQLGASQDLQIFHEAAGNSIIVETGSGNLNIQGNNVTLESTSGENYFTGTADGAATIYYDGSSKLNTTSTGVNVTGNTVSDGTQVDGKGYVSTSLHIGGTSDATTTLEVTGSVSVSTTSTLTGEVTFGAAAKPDTTGQDLGDATKRWDAFLSNTSVATYLFPATSGDDLGSTSLRWDIFGNDADINALTVNNNTILGSDGADTLTVNAESDFNANATFTNIIVEGVANIQTLEIEVLTANGVAMLATETSVTTTGDQEIDNLPFSESRGFKYIVQGRNENDSTSAYGVEIMCVHNGTDVFFSRYGEISNSIDVTITPTTNSSHIILNANCPNATGTDIHTFNVVKIETT